MFCVFFVVVVLLLLIRSIILISLSQEHNTEDDDVGADQSKLWTKLGLVPEKSRHVTCQLSTFLPFAKLRCLLLFIFKTEIQIQIQIQIQMHIRIQKYNCQAFLPFTQMFAVSVIFASLHCNSSFTLTLSNVCNVHMRPCTISNVKR